MEWSDSLFGSGFIVKFSFLYLSLKKLSVTVIEILLILVGKSVVLNKLNVANSFCLLALSSSKQLIFISPRIITFKELVFILLRIDWRVLKKYEKFHDGDLYVVDTQMFEEE